MIQTIITLLIVALAVALAIRHFIKLGRGGDCGCGCGDKCPHAHKDSCTGCK